MTSKGYCLNVAEEKKGGKGEEVGWNGSGDRGGRDRVFIEEENMQSCILLGDIESQATHQTGITSREGNTTPNMFEVLPLLDTSSL